MKALHQQAAAKEMQARLSRQQATEEGKEKISRASSFWDRSLDMGKQKKVRLLLLVRRYTVVGHGGKKQKRWREALPLYVL